MWNKTISMEDINRLKVVLVEKKRTLPLWNKTISMEDINRLKVVLVEKKRTFCRCKQGK